MNNNSPTALVILDGWGYSDKTEHNAIAQADPKTFNFLWQHYPHALLKASGTAVGLPAGVPGNSEVGHMTIGAGKIIVQPLTIINDAITDDSFFNNPHLLSVLAACKKKNGRLHLLGLLSDGNVHSNEQHLFALIKAAAQHHIPHVYVHAFLDGRDAAPRSAELYLNRLEDVCATYGGKLGSLAGRWYAMDRDENWERTLAVFEILTQGTPLESLWKKILEQQYANGITDEYIKPVLLHADARIQDNDTLIFFNIRPDRIRQLVALFLNLKLPSKKHKPLPTTITVPRDLAVASLIPYHKDFKNQTLFEERTATNTLLDKLEQQHKTIFTIAETEKYAHVTYFFSGGKEAQRDNETRVLIPSIIKTSYKDLPEMAASQITAAVVQSLEQQPADFYLINYANADMVGHSGNMQSTVQAIKCLDKQQAVLYKEFIEERNGTLYITADHGKAEEMWDDTMHDPKTAHSTNAVPFIMVRKDLQGGNKKLNIAQLCEITACILKNMS